MSLDGKFCTSCLRTIYEISNWQEFSDIKKKEIIKNLKKRKIND